MRDVTLAPCLHVLVASVVLTVSLIMYCVGKSVVCIVFRLCTHRFSFWCALGSSRSSSLIMPRTRLPSHRSCSFSLRHGYSRDRRNRKRVSLDATASYANGFLPLVRQAIRLDEVKQFISGQCKSKSCRTFNASQSSVSKTSPLQVCFATREGPPAVRAVRLLLMFWHHWIYDPITNTK